MNKEVVIKKLLDWWDKNQRKFPWRELDEASPWIVLGTAILLWKTKAENVAKVHEVFFHKFPNEKSFLTSPEVQVKNLLKATGLYNRKFLMFKKLAHLLNSSSFNQETLSNFGQYIRNLGRLVLYDENIIPVDAPVSRLLSRLFDFKVKNIRRLSPYEETFLGKLIRNLPPHRKKKVLYWALVDFADLICLPKKPLCAECPLKEECNFYKKKTKHNDRDKTA